MRIALFISSLQGGGSERQVAAMANLFSKNGHDISVVTFSDVLDDYSLCDKVKRVRLGEGKSRILKWWSIFHFFRGWDGDGVICFFHRLIRMAVVSNFFNKRNYVLIAGERASTEYLTVKEERRQKSWMYKRVNYVVSNSMAQNRHLHQIFPEYKDKMVAIQNYMNLSAFPVTPLPCSGIIKICVFAHYREEKNGEHFARAIKLVKERSSIRFIVEWYGRYMFNDWEYYALYPKMKRYVEEQHLEDVIKLNDRTDDVMGVIRNCDAVCIPSLREGFCNSISEGICCGRPILASRVGDNPIIVHEGQNGFLFDPTDELDISNTILKFLALSDIERIKMGERSRQIAEDLFDEDSFLYGYLQLMK